MDNCIFCETNQNKDFIYETKYRNIFLSWDQTYLWRTIISLKRHCKTLSNLKKEERTDYIPITKQLEKALVKSFDTTMFNRTCLMNNVYKNNKMQPNPHLHRHCRPRYNHTVQIEDIIFEDLEFGSHYDRTKKRIIPDQVRKIIIWKIQKNL